MYKHSRQDILRFAGCYVLGKGWDAAAAAQGGLHNYYVLFPLSHGANVGLSASALCCAGTWLLQTMLGRCIGPSRRDGRLVEAPSANGQICRICQQLFLWLGNMVCLYEQLLKVCLRPVVPYRSAGAPARRFPLRRSWDWFVDQLKTLCWQSASCTI